MHALQIIRRAIKSPLLIPWDHIDVALNPMGPTTHSPGPLESLGAPLDAPFDPVDQARLPRE